MSASAGNPFWCLRIHAAREIATAQFSSALDSAFGLRTVEVQRGIHISTAAKPSFATHFLKALPYQMIWSVQDKEDHEDAATLIHCRCVFPATLLLKSYALASLCGLLLLSIAILWKGTDTDERAGLAGLIVALFVSLGSLGPCAFLGFRVFACVMPDWQRLQKVLDATKPSDGARPDTLVVECLDTYQAPHRLLISLFHALAVISASMLPAMVYLRLVFHERLPLDLVFDGGVLGFIVLVCVGWVIVMWLTDGAKLSFFQAGVLAISPAFTALIACCCGLLIIFIADSGMMYITYTHIVYSQWYALQLGVAWHPREHAGPLYSFLAFLAAVAAAKAFLWLCGVWCSIVLCSRLYTELRGPFRAQAKHRYAELLRSGLRRDDSATQMATKHKYAAILVPALCGLLNWLLLSTLCLMGVSLLLTRDSWPFGARWIAHLLTPYEEHFDFFSSTFIDALGLRQTFALMLVVLAFLPALAVVAGNIHWSVSLHGKRKAMPKATGLIAKIVSAIATDLHLAPVAALIDLAPKGPYPYADIRGVQRRRFLIFSKAVIEVLETHPDHARAVIAHEMCHLKHDCPRRQRMRILSRLMLIGADTLSFMYDCMGLENEADQEAELYLESHKMRASLLKEAVALFADHGALNQYLGETGHGAAFADAKGSKRIPRETPKSPLRRWRASIWRHIRNTYLLYFFQENLFYLHPDPGVRGATRDGETEDSDG